jgi:Short C-terminal domain
MSTAEAPQLARGQSRGRSTAMWIVLVLAGLLLLLSAFAVWINRVALNTDVFADTSSTLLDDPKIRNAVANRAVDELYANVDVQAELKTQLPQDFKSLSGPAAAGLRQASYQIVDRALEQSAFQRLFKATLVETHRTLVDVLEGGSERVSTRGGEVTLDLRAIMVEAADRIGIGDQVVDRIPADAGQIVILRSDELDTAQNVFQLLKTLAWVLPILAAAAFAGAVLLARDRRRAVRGIGITLVVVGILGLLAARLTKNYVVNSLVAQRDDRDAADNAWNILTDLMRGSFRLMVVIGILFVVAAWVAGPGRRAIATRGWLAPAFRNRVWAYVVLAVVGLFLLASSQVTDFARLLVVLVIVALGAAWIELTRRQTLLEFPDTGGTSFVEDTWSRLSAWWEGQRAAQASRSTRAAPPPAAVPDVTGRLAALAELHAGGALTDEEYASAKARVLAGE